MGRPSKLTEKQWKEFERRHLAGEKLRPLAREFGISESAARERVSAQSKAIKSIANQIVETEQKLAALPITAQIHAKALADQLRSISSHLASAANYGAMTAHRIAGIVHSKIDQIDDFNPTGDDDSMTALKQIAGLTRIANESADIGLNLLRANKETVDSINREAEEPLLPTSITVERRSARIA